MNHMRILKHILPISFAVVLAVGCQSTPQGINQTSKVKVGTPIWEFETGGEVGGEIWTSLAIGSDGTVYATSGNKMLYALDGKSGTSKREFINVGFVTSPAIGSDDTVYIGSVDHKIYALDGKYGGRKWEFKTGDYVFSSPAIGSDGTVYIGSGDHKVYALDGKSGAKKWEFVTGESEFGVTSSPAIGSDGTVYVGSRDNKVYALKTDSKGLAKSSWPMRGQNARRSGRAPAK